MLAKILKAQCEKLGIQILCDTCAQKILKDDEKTVCGVLAGQAGKLIKVEAQVTVLATGGFLGDPVLLERYFPVYDSHFREEINIEGILHTGDGIKMALEAGAGNDGTISFEWSPNRLPFYKGDLRTLRTIPVLIDNARTPEAL
jgi:aspartate oxidase